MNIYFKVLSYLIAIGVVLGGLYWYGDSKYKEGYAVREAIAVKSESDAKTAAELKRAEMQATSDEAKRKANERAKTLETDAANSRIAADRLRNENASIRNRLPSITEQAVRHYADTASVILDNCTTEYQSMAAIADRLNNDRQQLEDAWPK